MIPTDRLHELAAIAEAAHDIAPVLAVVALLGLLLNLWRD